MDHHQFWEITWFCFQISEYICFSIKYIVKKNIQGLDNCFEDVGLCILRVNCHPGQCFLNVAVHPAHLGISTTH